MKLPVYQWSQISRSPVHSPLVNGSRRFGCTSVLIPLQSGEWRLAINHVLWRFGAASWWTQISIAKTSLCIRLRGSATASAALRCTVFRVMYSLHACVKTSLTRVLTINRSVIRFTSFSELISLRANILRVCSKDRCRWSVDPEKSRLTEIR